MGTAGASARRLTQGGHREALLAERARVHVVLATLEHGPSHGPEEGADAGDHAAGVPSPAAS